MTDLAALQFSDLPDPSFIPPVTSEYHRRESICRKCDQWDKVADGCSLLKPCDRYHLTRVYWERGSCRLGRWLQQPKAQSTKAKKVAALPSPDPNRQLCPSCDVLFPRPNNIEEVYTIAEQIVNSELKPPKFDLERCIVTSGEGKYELGIVIGIKLLRDNLKCQLPVKIFHNGKWETDLRKYDVELINTRDLQAFHPAKRFGGWESKTYAVMHANAKKVMFLDADAYLVNDPTVLFDLLDQHRYVLWADDGPGWTCGPRLDNQVLNLHHQNGGEYLVNLETYWSEMVAARWLDNWGEVWYRTGRLGDECTTRLIRSIINDKGVFRADWVDRKKGVGILCRYPAHGPAYVVHRMRRESKFFVGRYPNSCSWWPYEKEVFEYFKNMIPNHERLKMVADHLKTREGRMETRRALVKEIRAKKVRRAKSIQQPVL